MSAHIMLTLTLDASLGAALGGYGSRSVALACIWQHREIAVRHRMLIELVETPDPVFMG